VYVNPDAVDAGPERGIIRVDWRVTNLTDAPIEVLETWLPHGRFFAERQALEPPLILLAGASAVVRRNVRYAAEPGEVVENAFLNLRVRFGGRLWRALARMRVQCALDGDVRLAVQALTVDQVGFAETVTQEGRR